MPTSTRWVTFDCFGTLVDWNSGFATILRPFAGNKTDDLLRAYHRFERMFEAERPHRLYKDILTMSLLRAAREVEMPLTTAQAEMLPQQWESMPVFADVEEALESLRKAGYRLAVLTNCDNDLFKLTQRSFRTPFDLVVTAEQVGAYKPSLAHFEVFSRRSGVPRANWVHVACSWFHDIAPSRQLGIQTIWLDRELSGDDLAAASLRILTAKELPDALSTLFTKTKR